MCVGGWGVCVGVVASPAWFCVLFGLLVFKSPKVPLLTSCDRGTHIGPCFIPQVRLYTCKSGFLPTPSAGRDSGPVAVCQQDGSWSHTPTKCSATTTTTTATTITTTTPKPQNVRCTVHVNNLVKFAWLDGKRVLLKGLPFGYNAGQGTYSAYELTFLDSAKVLSFKALDGECGCYCGGFVSTPSALGSWFFRCVCVCVWWWWWWWWCVCVCVGGGGREGIPYPAPRNPFKHCPTMIAPLPHENVPSNVRPAELVGTGKLGRHHGAARRCQSRPRVRGD